MELIRILTVNILTVMIMSLVVAKRSRTNSASGVRKPSQVPPVHRVPAHLARRFHQVCLGILAEVTGTEGLSPLQYGIVASIDDEPRMDQRRLAERIGVDTVSAHHHIEYLEERGFVDRRIDPSDRRARLLYLTPVGLKIRDRLRPALVEAHARVTHALSQRERVVLLNLLTRVIESNESYARPGNGRRRPPKRITQLME